MHKQYGATAKHKKRKLEREFIINREWIGLSLVPRPSLTAFFAAVAKSVVFCHGCEKSCEGRPGYEARLDWHSISVKPLVLHVYWGKLLIH